MRAKARLGITSVGLGLAALLAGCGGGRGATTPTVTRVTAAPSSPSPKSPRAATTPTATSRPREPVSPGDAELAAAFRRLADPALQGRAYVAERDRFLVRKRVEIFLELVAAGGGEKEDTASCILAAVLLSRLREKNSFTRTEEHFQEAVATIVGSREERGRKALGPSTVAGRELMPDPMYHFMFCKTATEIERFHASAMSAVDKAVRNGYSPSGRWEPGYLPPGETPDRYRQRVKRGLRAACWDNATPALGPCMLEITLKGWPDEAAVVTLKKKRWGDFHRYMAVHLLGELRFNEAADYLFEVLKDGRADRYLRAHAARALSKIALPKHFLALVETSISNEVPQEIYREVRFDHFEANEGVRISLSELERARSSGMKKALAALAAEFARRSPRKVGAVRENLRKLLGTERDARVRLAYRKIRDGLEGSASPAREMRSFLNSTLEFENCLPPDDWEVMGAASEGKAAPDALAAAQKRYIVIVDKIAAQYTRGNTFATRGLHNEGWPGSVTDAKARAFFRAAAGLTVGISEAAALKALRATEEEIDRGYPDVSLGKRIARPCIRRSFASDVEGPYGIRRSWNKVLLVFVDGKLRLVHAPQR